MVASTPPMIALFTDFGLEGPYTGQMKAVLHREAPGIPVIDLFADAPAANPRASAYLLAAHAQWFGAGTVLLAVVDPGVGSMRRAIVVEADGRWYVGPDNGLFELVLRYARGARCWEIAWQPEALSASFHGRDLFAPVAAMIARGDFAAGCVSAGRLVAAAATPMAEWPDDLSEIVYIDHYGNAMTGMRAAVLPRDARLDVGGREIVRARTFSDVAKGQAFWYENSNGLAEIAVNSRRADSILELRIGSAVAIRS